MSIDPHHMAIITASGISEHYAYSVRGYASVSKRAELERAGFAPKQRLPGLLIPVHNVHGDRALYQLRPDQPRVVNGKALKYETPAGASMIVDVPPPVRPQLSDPSVPLFVTEGVRKADAAAVQGIACVALLGVWNWRGSNDKGGKLALPCWDSIALNDRKVYVVFDSDVMEKLPVHLALGRLKGFLEQRGAQARLVYLPPGDGGQKVGLDDFLVAGNGIEQLLERATSSIKEPPLELRAKEGQIVDPLDSWLEMQGCTVESKIVDDNPIFEARLRGVARVAKIESRWQEDEEQPGGWKEERRLTYRFDLASGEVVTKVLEPGQLPVLKVLESELASAVCCHRSDDRSKLFSWIHRQSADTQRVEVRRAIGPHGDLGWLCPPNWAIREGRVEHTDCVVEQPTEIEDLKRFRFAKIDAPRFREVARWVVAKLLRCDFSDRATTLPLLGAFMSAPIAHYVPTLDSWQRYAFFVQGPSGIGKTQLMRYFASFWGDFLNPKGLQSWASTTTFIEDLVYRVVAAPVFVSDWKLSNFGPDELKRARKLLQSYGDRTARGRCTSSAEAQQKKPPRAVLVIDGEDLPEKEQSTLGRMVVVHVQGDPAHLGLCAHASTDTLDPSMMRDLPGVTARWIAWVQRSVPWIEDQLPGVQAELDRRLARGSTNRARALRNYTIQALTVLAFAQFLEDEAGIEGAVAELHPRSLEVHAAHANHQLGRIVGEAAGEQFLAGLRAVLWAGLGRLRNVTPGGGPTYFREGTDSAPVLGSHDNEWAWVWPAVALPVIQQHLTRGGGGRIEFSEGAIEQQLEASGVIVAGGEARTGKRPRARDGAGVRRRAWRVRLEELLQDEDV